ncbi:MAG: hypothetical protein KBONHNOK_00959 [Candidatus Methanoperedenaceae archaeon GB50]|nr:MAG: hypothetical protein KBONHNOK_00959 [Candidatus Methanoperedenaceae archaeon GB50]
MPCESVAFDELSNIVPFGYFSVKVTGVPIAGMPVSFITSAYALILVFSPSHQFSPDDAGGFEYPAPALPLFGSSRMTYLFVTTLILGFIMTSNVVELVVILPRPSLVFTATVYIPSGSVGETVYVVLYSPCEFVVFWVKLAKLPSGYVIEMFTAAPLTAVSSERLVTAP